MPELNPDEFEDLDDYACAVQAAAVADAARSDFTWAIAGDAPDDTWTKYEYAIEPDRGDNARAVSDDLYDAVEALPDFRAEARIVTRTVTYSPWRYATPQEIREGGYIELDELLGGQR